jgi:hypothetical protein
MSDEQVEFSQNSAELHSSLLSTSSSGLTGAVTAPICMARRPDSI